MREQLTLGLIAAQRAGEVRAEIDAAAAASQLISLMDGLTAQRALAGGDLDIVAIFEAYVALLRAG